MIAIIDYDMGNLRSVQKGFEHVGFQAEITRDLQRIASARGVVLPGVGAFNACMENLRRFGLVEAVQECVQQNKPFLGICLGFQLLFSESEEFGRQDGLDLFPGKVVGFQPGEQHKVPHMGWNTIKKQKESPFLDGIPAEEFVYFVHSYYVVPDDTSLIATTTPYGLSFASSIATDHLFACQFHPEKSQSVGLRILSNFAQFAERS